MKKFSGTFIGLIISIISFCLTFTIIIPVFSLFPAALIESFSSLFVSNNPYYKVVYLTIFLLTFLLLVSYVLLYLFIIKKQKLNSKLTLKNYVFFMLILFFIIHPIGFYIYWGIKYDFKSDGQMIFEVYYSFPFSSLLFVFFGLIIDIITFRIKNYHKI